MHRSILALALLTSVAGCTAAQVQTAQTVTSSAIGAVEAACADAKAAGLLASATARGGTAATVANINGYVAAGCLTAEAVSTLAANSSSLAWLGQQTGALKTLAAPAVSGT